MIRRSARALGIVADVLAVAVLTAAPLLALALLTLAVVAVFR